MHLLIPFASCHAEGCQSSLGRLHLPQLQQLIAQLTLVDTDTAPATSHNPPHERALARAFGLPTTSGLIPWAAWQQGSVQEGWAFLSLCHWHAQSGQVSLRHPDALQLTGTEAHSLLASLQPFFAEDGIRLSVMQPGLWLAQGEVFKQLPTASLDRVIGRNIDPWMPEGVHGKTVRRLQNEMQMLLYTHPVNEARTAQGLPPVNSFWVHGSGHLEQMPQAPDPMPVVPESLRQAALREDWDQWVQAWQAVDQQECAQALTLLQQGQSVTLTLCGEQSAQRYEHRPHSLWRRMKSVFGTTPMPDVWRQL